jgi:hypothetical protein
VGHASRSSDLLYVEARLARVFSLASRLAEVRQRVVHVAPSQMLCQSQVEDGRVDTIGCVRSCYPCFIIFILLCHRSTVVI